MKRFSLLFLLGFISLSLQASSYPDKTVTLTLTVGMTHTITTYEDLGIPFNYVAGIYENASSENNGSYYLSDQEAIAVVPEYKINARGSKCYSYKLTPQATGYFTFVQSVSNYTYDNGLWFVLGQPATITYNITVIDVTGIIIPSPVNITIGDCYSFSPILVPNNATTNYTWNSLNHDVVTIADDGTINAIGIGSAVITCMAHNGVTTTSEVTVTPKLVSNIALNQEAKELILGEQLELQATIVPDNATNKAIHWSSSNESVAVVNESGLVTAVGAGLCNITAATKDGSELTASCLVTVLGNVMFCEGLGAVPGATVTLPIQLANEDAIQGFEFELVLPDGVRVETNSDGKLAATLTERFSTTGLDGALLENGNYKFVFTSTSRILGKEGAVVNVPLVVADDAVIGTYDITIKNVELVKYGTSSQIHHGDRTATLTIKEMTLGDVNGDGRVSVADAISIINYVLGRNPVSFITKAADVNGDESISLADAVAVVDIILGRSSGNVKAFIQELITLDPQ